MKQQIKNGLITGVIASMTILSLWVVYAAWDDVVSSGDPLNAASWNEVVERVKLLNVDSGNIGIWKSLPEWPLHIASSLPYIALEDTDDANGSYWVIHSYQDGWLYYDANRNDSLTKWSHHFRVDWANELLTILNNWNVWIGTESPSYNLDIYTAWASLNIWRPGTWAPSLFLRWEEVITYYTWWWWLIRFPQSSIFWAANNVDSSYLIQINGSSGKQWIIGRDNGLYSLLAMDGWSVDVKSNGETVFMWDMWIGNSNPWSRLSVVWLPSGTSWTDSWLDWSSVWAGVLVGVWVQR